MSWINTQMSGFSDEAREGIKQSKEFRNFNLFCPEANWQHHAVNVATTNNECNSQPLLLCIQKGCQEHGRQTSPTHWHNCARSRSFFFFSLLPDPNTEQTKIPEKNNLGFYTEKTCHNSYNDIWSYFFTSGTSVTSQSQSQWKLHLRLI